MKVGILGAGFGAHHARIYKNLDSVNGVKVFGRNKEKLNQIKNNSGIEVTDNIDDIMADTDIDLIDVCLPSSLHKEYVVEALKNGKHVFCETPVALNLEDAIAMKAAEDKYGRRVFVNLFIKHEHPYEYLCQTAQNNTLGKLTALHIWRKTPPLWGNLGLDHISTNLIIHDFDFITWLLGSPENISAAGMNGKEGESEVQALLKYEDAIVDVQGSSMMPLSHPFTVGYEAVFENGTVQYNEDGYKDRAEASLVLFDQHDKTELEILEQDCYEESIKHVIECCTMGVPTKLSLEDAIRSLKIALKIKDSIV